jgi:sulfur-oxidizing protein SoxB
MQRREFLSTLAAAAGGGLVLETDFSKAALAAEQFYNMPPKGNVHLLHFTDSHAQLVPTYYREPSVNLGAGSWRGKTPHLVGERFLKANGIAPGSPEAHAFTSLNFDQAARTYGKIGGFAHLAALVKRLKASRPGALLLDGGDTWQGSATALWTRGQDMVDASLLMGVDIMTSHWEMTLGAERVLEIVNQDFKNKLSFLAQNIKTTDFEDPVFDAYQIRVMNGVPVAIIGQSFPYTPIANPRYMVPDWTFGIQEENMQKTVNEVRARGAQVVVVLSHNGMDVDLKMATRLSGIDVILGGHTHDAVPRPVQVRNRSGSTWVTNAGSNGKFLAVLDFEVKAARIVDFHYRLMPVFAHLIEPDAAMLQLIERVRKPFQAQLSTPLALTQSLLYRRGNFNGSFDQLILDGLMAEKEAEIAFSPGFRWGASLLSGDTITLEDLMNQTAITYPATTLTPMSGQTIKTVLEDVADNLFNPDPYYQQGGDMVRVAGMQYSIEPGAASGQRISNMRLKGQAMQADKIYKVAGWASVNEDVKNAGGEPIWDLMSRYLSHQKVVDIKSLNTPEIIGAQVRA